ncbi:MAG: acyloxyacyl hydrolase [Xanthomonadales bacterium]|nr:acyloxyacyl hydrolase [Xanthomonadales bacterium]
MYTLPLRRTALVAVFVVLLGGHAGPIRSEWQLAGGLADEIDDDRAPVVTLGWLSGHRFPVELVGGYIGPRQTRNQRIEETLFLGADLRWIGRGWFLGGGIAAVGETSEVLSSDWQFMTLAGLRRQRLVLTLRHLSNAGTGGRNRGETFLTAGWAW